MSGQIALVLGATGQTGGHILREVLASPYYSKVAEYGRKLTPIDSLPEKEKLEQKTIDFDNLSESGLKDQKWDTVFIALGTSKKIAGSAEAFERIDRQYVLDAAREARIEGHDQRVIYVSVEGAHPNSNFLYPRSKGLTEHGLASLGYKDTIIFRPGMITHTSREEYPFKETVAMCVADVLSRFTNWFQIPVATLGKAIRIVGVVGSEDLPTQVKATKEGPSEAPFTVVNTAGALALAATEDA